ncbi:hypothetical protein PIB30_026603 [Stylosanthes scabra]|uniref:Uncharacterized protein n=1 Tax=Stylosanthes scabra TaxID=79078 RepID=A0ABU6V8S1_9FABA|nr:hypothetical protein [Stylosanthes scabra]
MSIMDDASLQQMISIHLENMAYTPMIELSVEFEQIPYVDGAVEEVQLGLAFEDVADVANALANELPFQEPSFMRVLDEDALNAPEFAEDMNPDVLNNDPMDLSRERK